MAADREGALAGTTAALRKLYAAKGKLQGNFYFITDTKEDLVLIATLVARDKRGTKAMGMGKPFRKEIKSAKFSRGSVTFENGRLVFRVLKGNAPAKSMQKGLKQNVSKEKGLSFLKRALVVTGAADSPEAEPIEALTETEREEAAVEEQVLSEEIDMSEVDELINDQKALGTLTEINRQLEAFFTDEEDETKLEEQLAEDIQSQINRLDDLKSQDIRDDAQIAAAWTELASLAAVGKNNLPEIGEAVDPEVFNLVQAAIQLTSSGETIEDGEATFLKALESVRRRYNSADEPESVSPWLVQVLKLKDEGQFTEGIKMLETEVEWRLKEAERVTDVSEEIGEGVVDFAKAILAFNVAFNEGNQQAADELNRFQMAVLASAEVSNDPRFPEVKSRLASVMGLLPDYRVDIKNALDEIINAAVDDRQDVQNKAITVIDTRLKDLQKRSKLRSLDKTVFGDFQIFQGIQDALQTLRDDLSTLNR
ncbi:MAG: hypothetical protein AAFV53_14645 [Myxococcota bacterium]